jgi:hypothetical protein
VQIKVKADFSRAKALIDGTIKQVPFATATALTATARAVQREIEREIDQVFDAPVTFTRRGVGITPATKLQLRAEVFLKRKQAAYLEAQIAGGARRRRPFEAQFSKQLGRRLAASVPGQGAPIDQAGNIKRAVITRIGRAVANRKGKYFEAKPGGPLQPGIYERQAGRKIAPILIFSQQPAKYTRRLDFFGIGRKVVAVQWPVQFSRAFKRAVATAK